MSDPKDKTSFWGRDAEKQPADEALEPVEQFTNAGSDETDSGANPEPEPEPTPEPEPEPTPEPEPEQEKRELTTREKIVAHRVEIGPEKSSSVRRDRRYWNGYDAALQWALENL